MQRTDRGSDTQIAQPCGAIRHNEYVGRLHIAMHDSGSVNKSKRGRNRSNDLEHFAKRSAAQPGDITTRGILHRQGDVNLVLVNSAMHSERLNDVGMPQPSQQRKLVIEIDGLFALRLSFCELQRDLSSLFAILSEPNLCMRSRA